MYTHFTPLLPLRSNINFKDIYFSARHISLPAYLLLCLWFFIAYTNYVWQSTEIMNSSRFACYLYKNKFIILISFFYFPQSVITCAIRDGFRSNLTEILQTGAKSQTWINIVKNWNRQWIQLKHTCYCFCTHFSVNGQTFSLFFHLFFVSWRLHEKFCVISLHEILFVRIFVDFGRWSALIHDSGGVRKWCYF